MLHLRAFDVKSVLSVPKKAVSRSLQNSSPLECGKRTAPLFLAMLKLGTPQYRIDI